MERRRRPDWAGTGRALCGAIALLAAAPALARPQEEPAAPAATPAPPAFPPEAYDEDAPPPKDTPDIHPDTVSRFQKRVYKVRPKRLWQGLLKTLEAAGHPPEEVEAENRTVRTSFVDFKQKDYADPVADPPPRMGAPYHIITLKRVVEGKMSFEAVINKAHGGSEIRIRARILVQGLDRRKRIMVMVDRRSTGVMEAAFLARLEADLGIAPAPPPAS